jgi:hypothetical protein
MDKATQAPQTGATYEYGSLAVPDANGTASAATASESGVSWLDSAALAECRRLTAENAALAERNAELRAALDEQGDELAALRRGAASVPTELENGRLLIVADSIASDGEGLRTIEAYGHFYEREDGGRDGWMKLPVDADGVPIHVGDRLEHDGVEIGSVTAVGFNAEPRVWVLPNGKNVSVSFCASDVRHHRQQTVEDVLRDMLEHADAYDASYIDAYADVIRELMEVER